MLDPALIGGLAADALRVEARLTPKPGLVDAEGRGAHPDMDLDLLLRSADALEPALVACAEAGASGAAPDELVRIGLAGERAMFAATGGVNAHKGALFSLGLLAYCAADTTGEPMPVVARRSAGLAEPKPRRSAGVVEPSELDLDIERTEAIDAICARAGEIATPWCNAWVASMVLREPSTHGERAYVGHGLLGARGEAAAGYATVRAAGLWTLWRALDADRPDALLRVLVALMAANPDTNLVARGGVEALETVRAWSQRVVDADPDPDRLEALLRSADAAWSARRWSPGGSADLLAVTWFLDQVGTRRAVAG